MTIDEMIKILQRIRGEHGNLEVFHSDSEWGDKEASILLFKEQMSQDQTQEETFALVENGLMNNVKKYVCIV